MDKTVSTLQTVRNVAQQTGFARKVFASGAQGLSPGQLTMEFRQILQAAGITPPVPVAVSLDVVQGILAGGTFVEDIDTGASILQCAGSGFNMINAGLMLLKDLGIGGDVVSQLSDFTSLGSNLALAISSGGANILADIGAVIALVAVVGDLGRDFFGDHDAAAAAAKRALSDQVRATYNPELNFAAAQVQAFQKGSLTYFDLVGSIAMHSPLVFKNFFPGLACYFPSWGQVGFSQTSTSQGLFGSSSDTETVSLTELLSSRAQIESVLFNYYIGAPLKAFEGFFSVSTGISLRAISTLGMLLSAGVKGDVKITESFDVLSACRLLGITPGILGDTWLFKGLARNELEVSNWRDALPYRPLTFQAPPTFTHSGLMINGHEILSRREQGLKRARDQVVELQLTMQALDQSGDIENLWKIPEARALLSQWATFHPARVLAAGIDPLAFFDPAKTGLSMPVVYSDPSQIDLSDYWKCLGLGAQMLKSELFSDASGILLSMGNLNSILDNVKRVQSFVIAKQMNVQARANVSRYTGIPVSGLGTRLTSNHTRVFYRKAG